MDSFAALLRKPAGSGFRSLERGAIAAGVEEVGRIGAGKSASRKSLAPLSGFLASDDLMKTTYFPIPANTPACNWVFTGGPVF